MLLWGPHLTVAKDAEFNVLKTNIFINFLKFLYNFHQGSTDRLAVVLSTIKKGYDFYSTLSLKNNFHFVKAFFAHLLLCNPAKPTTTINNFHHLAIGYSDVRH